jgi:hypothetical protein
MTQETVTKSGIADLTIPEVKRAEKKNVGIPEIVESLKSAGDDIGQISELTSEEKLLVAQFFSSLLKLMQPLAPSIAISTAVLPLEVGDVSQAHIDPSGHLALTFEDGHLELKDLSAAKNRDLMMAVVGDMVPKFKNLTSAAKRKVENRIKFLSSVTKEMQKNSDALSASLSGSSGSEE